MPSLRRLRRRRAAPATLREHPNAQEIVVILNRLPRLTEREVARIARGWRDNIFLAQARDRALTPESPLVIEVLASFDRVDEAVFAAMAASTSDAMGEELLADDGTPSTLPTHITFACKAIRDAIAAAYARPMLSRAEYIALIGPWRRTFPGDNAITARDNATR